MTAPSGHAAALPLEDHPLRRALTAELHLRQFPVFAAPARLMQIVMFPGEENFTADQAAAYRLCDLFHAVPTPGKHFICGLGTLRFVWERHTEFTSYTFIREGGLEPLFANDILTSLPAEWVAQIPGKVLRATNIAVLGPDDAEPDDDQVAAIFPKRDLVSCHVAAGGARVWSDFQVHDDGLGRLLIHNRSLLPGDLSRLVQHLQELGNYRNMALLGLPEAQALAPELTALDRRLGRLTDQIAAAHASGSDDERLLSDLSALAAEVGHLTSRTSYRMQATEAYAELVQDRLRSVGGERVPGFPTLADFTERRLVPGVRTCRSFTRRVDDLSNRTSWTSSLLRTRVETTMERQSRDLLFSMNQRTDLQLRLQQTVEGLSVVAIACYGTELFHFVAAAGHEVYPRLNETLATAAAVPVIIFLVSWALRRMKRRLHPRGEDPTA